MVGVEPLLLLPPLLLPASLSPSSDSDDGERDTDTEAGADDDDEGADELRMNAVWGRGEAPAGGGQTVCWARDCGWDECMDEEVGRDKLGRKKD